ncbi:ATP-binding protein [Rhizocola hellebori]|uniref:ATP-binding protein n=1 Tax=Rhizocola hellebori TaxID=1392758 RepID=A0A8J3Q6C7_9ACTN|nr:ATP/GTP-binding protein [Rhizocola hellebori]GIH04088.1 ATP-binding protein [Rhizocola hellebori]
MDYGPCDELPSSYKILVAGGFGVGKTTLVSSISEIRPLITEEILTGASIGVDNTQGVEAKNTTTVALDFGRITIDEQLVLYLFGTPGQQRFLFVWDELAYGAIGAIIVADTRRLAESFASIDYFEQRGTPFLVAVNCFEGARRYDCDEIKQALNLDPAIPVCQFDARSRASVKSVLIGLVQHLMARAEEN